MPTRRQACPYASKSRARSPEGAALSAEVALEPGDRELAHVRERAGLFEQVPRAGDDDQLVMCAQELRRVPVELEHLRVALADDQQRRREHANQLLTGQVWAPAARDDRCDLLAHRRRREQGGRGACGGTEVADGKGLQPRPRAQLARELLEPPRQQRDVEGQLPPAGLAPP